MALRNKYKGVPPILDHVVEKDAEGVRSRIDYLREHFVRNLDYEGKNVAGVYKVVRTITNENGKTFDKTLEGMRPHLDYDQTLDLLRGLSLKEKQRVSRNGLLSRLVTFYGIRDSDFLSDADCAIHSCDKDVCIPLKEGDIGDPDDFLEMGPNSQDDIESFFDSEF